MYYTGRDMQTTHRGMKISATDWQRFSGHLQEALSELQVPESEGSEVLSFIESTRRDIVEIENGE